MKTILACVIMILMGAVCCLAADPNAPDTIKLQEIELTAGHSGVMNLSIISDDTTNFNDNTWQGIGSFCIPLKYDRSIMKVDSVKFEGVVAQWDEKFCNTKLDTGFVSLAGIFNLGGADNPPIHSPGKYEIIAGIYFTIAKKAPNGIYGVILTKDPIQNEMYCGSTDGFHSWKPEFVPGKVIIK
jgi:hypothetical protein